MPKWSYLLVLLGLLSHSFWRSADIFCAGSPAGNQRRQWVPTYRPPQNQRSSSGPETPQTSVLNTPISSVSPHLASQWSFPPHGSTLVSIAPVSSAAVPIIPRGSDGNALGDFKERIRSRTPPEYAESSSYLTSEYDESHADSVSLSDDRPVSRQSTTSSSLEEMPNNVINDICSSLQNPTEAYRNLALVCKVLNAKVIHTTGFKFKYHAMFQLPSILFCIKEQNLDCLAYWTTKLDRLTPSQRVSVIIAFHTETDLAFGDPEFKHFSNAFRSALSISENAYIANFERLLYVSNYFFSEREQLKRLDQMSVEELSAWKRLFLPMIDMSIKQMNKCFNFIMKSGLYVTKLFSSSSVLQLGNTLLHLLDGWNTAVTDPTATWDEVKHFFLTFHSYAVSEIKTREFQYIEFLSFMNTHIDTVKLCVNGGGPILPPEVYPVRHRLELDLEVSIVMDQYLFTSPTVLFWETAMKARRLDILIWMVRDIGFMSVVRNDPFMCNSLITSPYEYAKCFHPYRKIRYNLLYTLMQDILHPARPEASHPSWGPDALGVLKLFLENGGSSLVYPNFVCDAIQLGNVRILQYLLHDLGIEIGVNHALSCIRSQPSSSEVGGGRGFGTGGPSSSRNYGHHFLGDNILFNDPAILAALKKRPGPK